MGKQDFPLWVLYSLDDVRESNSLRAKILDRFSSEDFDIEYIIEFIAEHIVDHYDTSDVARNYYRYRDEKEQSFQEALHNKAWNSAHNIIDDVISEMPCSRPATEALVAHVKGMLSLHACGRLLNDLAIYLTREEYEFVYSEMKENFFGDEITQYWDTYDVAFPRATQLLLGGVVQGVRRVHDGMIIRALREPWARVIDILNRNPEAAYQIDPFKWEEIIAAALEQDEFGFDRIVLTPRSGDKGRDVIAEKRGWPSVRILYSVKAYSKNNRVTHDDVRGLLGVLSADSNASKAILTTTSQFAPNIIKDEYIRKFIPYRLELMDGKELRKWLLRIRTKR